MKNHILLYLTLFCAITSNAQNQFSPAAVKFNFDNIKPTINAAFSINSGNDYVDAYIGDATSHTYSAVNLSTGEKTYIGALNTSPFPTGEDYDGTNIYRLHENGLVRRVSDDGAITNIGVISGCNNAIGLAYDWINSDGTWYFYDIPQAQEPYHLILYKLDMTTLTKTQVGISGATNFLRGLAMGDDGNLFALDMTTSSLVIIDTSTAQISDVGQLGILIGFAQDIAFDRETGILYASPLDFTDAQNLACKFGTINTSTGAFTEIASYGLVQHATMVVAKGEPPLFCPSVTNLQAEIQGTDALLTWSSPAEVPTSYNIYSGINLLETIEGGTSYLFSNLSEGEYTFGVEAIYDDNCVPLQITTNVSIRVANPIKNLNGNCTDGILTLTWDAPDPMPDFEGWISYSTSNYYGGIGVGGAWDVEWVQRFSVSKLAELGIVSGNTLTMIRFVLNSWFGAPITSGRFYLKVYQGTSSTVPGTELLEQEIAFSSLVAAAWNEFTLDPPIEIDPTKELWFGIRSDVPSGDPCAIDVGPGIPGVNLCTWNGQWYVAEQLVQGLNANWCLAGYVSTSAEGKTQIELKHDAPKTAASRYAIYRNNEKTGETTTTTFISTDNTDNTGTNNYCVVALYDTGAQSQKICKEIICNDDSSIRDKVEPSPHSLNSPHSIHLYPNPFKDEINIHSEHPIVNIQILNTTGQKVKEITNKTIKTNETIKTQNNPETSNFKPETSNGFYPPFFRLTFYE